MTANFGDNEGEVCNHAGCSSWDCFSLHHPPGDACARCSARDSFPLHRARDHVNRTYFRLCSSCLLKIHAPSFCCFCFDLIGDEKLDLVHCSKCPSVSHPGCLPKSTISSELLCPRCTSSVSTDSFSYLTSGSGRGRVIDLQSTKAFLAASRIAVNAMMKRAVVVNNDVDKKVRESAVAWKRARHLLASANVVCKEEEGEEEKEKESGISKERQGNEEEEEPKRKEQKRMPSREIEKWMRFHEPIPKGGFVESKSRVGLGSREEKGRKGSISGTLCKVKNHDS